jgi:hypothetical protein
MPEFKRSIAVVIGINQYVNSVPELKTAVKKCAQGFPRNKLSILWGGRQDPPICNGRDARPTRGSFKESIAFLSINDKNILYI